MNIYFIIILSTFILGFIIDNLADLLNLKNLKPELPVEFADVYSKDDYAKSQNYTRTLTKFGFVVSAFNAVVMLVFWLSGGFNLADKFVCSLTGNEIIRGLVFIGFLMLANSLINLPFSIYSTFVIEEKYGFNKTTAKTFILDLIKTLGLSVVIGLPLLALLLYLLSTMGSMAWLYGWAAVVMIGLIIQYVAPKWILPLFNKFMPMEDGELKNAILNLAEKLKFPLKDVYIMDGSKRSAKSNAFFTGFGKNKRIALFDTLIEKHSTDGMVAILAHEIGHYKKKHIQLGMIISFIHTGLVFYLLSVFLIQKELYDAFFMTARPMYAGLIFFGMLYSPVEMILSLFMNIISRKNEYAADEFAVNALNSRKPMIEALKKLSVTNLSNLTPHPFYVFVNYSHPTVTQRITAIKKIAAD